MPPPARTRRPDGRCRAGSADSGSGSRGSPTRRVHVAGAVDRRAPPGASSSCTACRRASCGTRPAARRSTRLDQDGFIVAAARHRAGRFRRARPRRPCAGTVETLAVAVPRRRAGAPARRRARALAGQGLEGDRHVAGTGTFPSGLPGSALTLIEAEVCESFDPPLEPSEHRRNVVTRGIDLNALVGHEFTIGEVRCRGMRLCEPCTVVQRYAGRPVLRAARPPRRPARGHPARRRDQGRGPGPGGYDPGAARQPLLTQVAYAGIVRNSISSARQRHAARRSRACPAAGRPRQTSSPTASRILAVSSSSTSRTSSGVTGPAVLELDAVVDPLPDLRARDLGGGGVLHHRVDRRGAAARSARTRCTGSRR